MSEYKVKTEKYNLIGGGLPYGCKVKNGKIVPAFSLGATDARCPTDIRYATFIHNTHKYYIMDNTSLYSAVENEQFRLVVKAPAQQPFFVEFKYRNQPVSQIVLDKKAVYFEGSGELIHDIPYNICGGVYKNGRAFGIDLTDRYKLRWSGEYGVDDWISQIDGAGWLFTDIELGEIYNLAVLNGHLAVIKKYGVSLISAYGSPEDFKEILTVATPTVYQHSAAVCGNKLYFYTVDGLYSFNESGVEKVEAELTEELMSAVYATSYGSTVFVAGTHRKLEKGVILAYDTKEKTSYFIDLTATAMAAGNSLYAYTPNGSVKLEKGKTFTYVSEEFGRLLKRKSTLKSIFVDCRNAVDITVETDSGRRVFKGVRGKLLPHISGRFFKVGVTGTSEPIKELTATVEHY